APLLLGVDDRAAAVRLDRLDVRALGARDRREADRHPQRDLPLRVADLVAVDEPLRRHDHVAVPEQSGVAAEGERPEGALGDAAQLGQLGRWGIRDYVE